MLHVLGTDTENSGSHKKEVFGVCHKRKAMTAPTNKYAAVIKGFKMTGRKSESCPVFLALVLGYAHAGEDDEDGKWKACLGERDFENWMKRTGSGGTCL